MSKELRVSLWNALDVAVWQSKDFMWAQYGEAKIRPFSQALWFHYFKRPADTRSEYSSDVLQEIRKYFFSCEWYEVYDFIEYVVHYFERSMPRLPEYLNTILERELSGFRFVAGKLTDIIGEQEIEMLQEVLADTRFAGVTEHLNRSLELYSDREKPDYRNSIKESISAVESMARIVSENPKATLGDALKEIDKKGVLHPALKAGFLKIYGYTSDKEGIRHAMLDESNLTGADARYFLVSCTSFVNYLKSLMAS